jgi:quinol monooxygenase YgiN
MSTILARITVHAGKEAEFESLAVTMHQASHATEPGLRGYGYWRAQQPRQYYTLLAFDDYRSFLAHQASDHHEAAGADLRGCIESMTLEWVDPVAGASKLAPTNPQDTPVDASPVMTRYAERMPAEVAAWWKPARAVRAAATSSEVG